MSQNDPGEQSLHEMTKVEVVVNGADVPDVQGIFEKVGVTGFTMLGNVSGLGHGGFHEGRLAFNDRDGLVMLITVAPSEVSGRLVDRLRTFLANRPGVMFVTDTRVSRPGYFTG
ncbi:MAG: hypothetical protein RIE08_01745 [Acidimicrobiales bacterium]